MIWPTFLTGKTLGETAYLTLRAALVITVLALLAWVLIAGKFWAWRAAVWQDRAEEAAGEAVVAQRQYKSSDQGAQNATLTREQMDLLLAISRPAVEGSAVRIEDYANRPDRPASAGDDAAPDDVVLEELEGAEDTYRAAANRLQRTRAR